MSKNPVISTAKEVSQNGAGNIITLSDGRRAKLLPVSSTLIDAVTNKIKDPEVPMWFDEDKQRESPNPADPDYNRALEEAGRKRGLAALDALAMFGIELLDGVPEDRTWIKKLKILHVDLDEYNLDDEMEVEFLYKRFFVANNDVIQKLSEVSGINPDEIQAAEATFPSDKER